MKVRGYLVINRKGSCRFVKNRVGLNWDEISIMVSIEMPDTLFVRPMLQANIKLEGDFENKFDFEVKQDLTNLINHAENIHLLNINVINEKEEENNE